MFLSTYLKVRKIFRPPKFRFFIGKWRNEGNLPVWRRGNIIKFAKNSLEFNQDWDYARLKSAEWTETGKKNHPILSKIVKPIYILPTWLSFYIFNSDIMYKIKWAEDDYRYEFPAHFTIVFFGFAISITAYEDCLYWESVLLYIHYKGDVKKACDRMGIYTQFSKDKKTKFFGFKAEFLKDNKLREQLIQYQNEVLPISERV